MSPLLCTIFIIFYASISQTLGKMYLVETEDEQITSSQDYQNSCRNFYSNCDDGNLIKHCYQQNIKNGCKRTCGLCPGQTPVESTHCWDDWGDNCKKYVSESCHAVGQGCRKSCGLCKGMTPHPSNTCYNQYSNCDELAHHCKNSQNTRNNCRKTCNACEGTLPPEPEPQDSCRDQ